MATLIQLFPFLLIVLVAGAVFHALFGGKDARKTAGRKLPRHHWHRAHR